MRNHVVRKIFERRSFAKLDHGFQHRWFFGGPINSSCRGGRQTDMRVFFLSDFRMKVIAAKHSTRRIEEHQVRGSIFQRKRSERLQRQREARLAENCPWAATLELQPQETVSPDSLRIRRAGSGVSTR